MCVCVLNHHSCSFITQWHANLQFIYSKHSLAALLMLFPVLCEDQLFGDTVHRGIRSSSYIRGCFQSMCYIKTDTLKHVCVCVTREVMLVVFVSQGWWDWHGDDGSGASQSGTAVVTDMHVFPRSGDACLYWRWFIHSSLRAAGGVVNSADGVFLQRADAAEREAEALREQLRSAQAPTRMDTTTYTVPQYTTPQHASLTLEG